MDFQKRGLHSSGNTNVDDGGSTLWLSSLRLPETGTLRRDTTTHAGKGKKGYAKSYDAHSLIYDCFYDTQKKQIVLVCPRLLNLWPVLRDGLALDGELIVPSVRRKRHLRVEILRIPAPERPADLEVRINHERHSIPVLDQSLGSYAGRNVLMAISKDNPIEWIVDWALYHVSAHGADAVLLFDNGSTDYDPKTLEKRIAAVPGIQVAKVISCPFPYGGRSNGLFGVPTKFLQTSMFNVAQLRFLAAARAVLSVDIDELVWPGRVSIFDAAVKSSLGMVSFFGHWVYPADAGPARAQRDHAMRADHKLIENPKWCIVPDSLAGRFSWAVHRPGGLLYPLTIRRRLGFWHCFATSTGWKHKRTKPQPLCFPCQELTNALDRHLPPVN